MKRIVPILLLLLLFILQAGYFVIFSIPQYPIKEQVKRQLLTRIPESFPDIIEADINKDDIEWEDENREFFLHGRMYDGACIKKLNGRILIHCLNDKKEEQLLQEYSKMITQHPT